MADIVFRGHADEIQRQVHNRLDTVLEAVGQAAEGYAIDELNEMIYSNPPSPHYVRTGDLKKSVSHKVVREEKAAYIGTNLEYAPYVEYGTRHMTERPFLRNAVQNHQDDYRELFEDGMSSL